MIFIWIVIIYLILVWVVARLVVPHLGFSKEKIPESLPTELEKKISEYNKDAENNYEFLELAYGYITDRYSGSRLKTITEAGRAFGDIFNKSSGFLPCTGQNYLLRAMLVK